jgi:hypothetical protein
VRLQNCEKRLLASPCHPVDPHVGRGGELDTPPPPPHWADFHGTSYLIIIWKYVGGKKIKIFIKMWRISGSLHEDVCAFTVFRLFFPLKMRNISDKNCRERQNTRFMISNFFLPENRSSYHLWFLRLQHFFHILINGTVLGGKKSQREMWLLIFSRTFIWNISHSEKNWARYYKCT